MNSHLHCIVVRAVSAFPNRLNTFASVIPNCAQPFPHFFRALVEPPLQFSLCALLVTLANRTIDVPDLVVHFAVDVQAGDVHVCEQIAILAIRHVTQ